ncbi:DUF433 domain-containing protein [Nocardioides pocheonensis]|nr:DUF433 domain-containing protein [Nocardioides pocheonensis]
MAFERITTDPDVMGGVTAAEIVDDLPDPTVEDVAEALREFPLSHIA